MEKRVETQEEILNYFSIPVVIDFAEQIINVCQGWKKKEKGDFVIKGQNICKKIPALDGYIYDAYIEFTFQSILIKGKNRSDFFEINEFVFYRDTIPDFVLDLLNKDKFIEIK